MSTLFLNKVSRCGEASVASAIETAVLAQVGLASKSVAGKQASRLRLKPCHADGPSCPPSPRCGEASVASAIETRFWKSGYDGRLMVAGKQASRLRLKRT